MLWLSGLVVQPWSLGRAAENTTTPQKVGIPQPEIVVAPETAPPAWQLVWDKAREMAQKGQRQGAVTLYRKLLHDRPGLLEARWEYAQLLVKGGDEAAIKELEQVVEGQPDNIDALSTLADLFKQIGQCDRATPIYERMLLIGSPMGQGAQSGPSMTARGPGRLSTADIHRRMAQCYERLGQEPNALMHLKQAFEAAPGRKDIETELAYLLARLHHPKEAADHFKHLLPALRQDPGFLVTYAEVLLEAGRVDAAKKTLLGLARIPGHTEPLGTKTAVQAEKVIGRILSRELMEGQTRAAIDLLEQVRAHLPSLWTPALMRSLGRLYFADRRYLDAMSLFTAIVSERPDDTDSVLFLARIYDHLQYLGLALQNYERALDQRWDDQIASHALALLIETNDSDGAADLLARAPGNFQASLEADPAGRILLFRLALDQGNLSQARRLAPGISPSASDILFAYAGLEALRIAQAPQGPYPELNAILSPLMANASCDTRGPILQNLTFAWAHSSTPNLALDLLQFCPDGTRSPWPVVDALSVADTFATSTVDIWAQRLLKEDRGSIRGRLTAALALLNAGQVEGAQKVLGRADRTGLAPWETEKLLLLKGQMDTLKGNYTQALASYDTLLHQYPVHIQALLGRQQTLLAYGFFPEADLTGQSVENLTGRKPAMTPPLLFLPDGDVPSPGTYLQTPKGCTPPPPDPKRVLNSALCHDGAAACSMLLAVADECHGDLQEAAAAWESFLRRNASYWPGYARLGTLLETLGQGARAEKMRADACLRLDASKASVTAPGQRPQTPEKADATQSWRTILCGPE